MSDFDVALLPVLWYNGGTYDGYNGGRLLKAILCILIGYLIGTLNPSYLIGKARGIDVKHAGSCTAGASNAIILMGRAVGIACGLFDIFKAYLAYNICCLLFPVLEYAGIVAGAGCILGHIFPVWMRFRGGKGLACLGGTILAHNWRLFCLMLVAEIVLALIVGYICMVAITASVVFPVAYAIGGGHIAGIAALCVVAVVMLVKHQENLLCIRQGREVRISYLWNKEAEEERMKGKY